MKQINYYLSLAITFLLTIFSYHTYTMQKPVKTLTKKVRRLNNAITNALKSQPKFEFTELDQDIQKYIINILTINSHSLTLANATRTIRANVKNNEGNAVLHILFNQILSANTLTPQEMDSYRKTAEQLLLKGANSNIINKNGISAKHWAIQINDKELLNLLKKPGRNSSAKIT